MMSISEAEQLALPRMSAVRQVIPRRCFEADAGKATRFLLLVAGGLAVSFAVSALVWAEGWWPLYPVAWAMTGTMFTSLFIVTHDCGHGALYRHRWLDQVVGHLASLPLLYPFAQWRAWHDAHHRRTNVAGQTFEDQIRGRMDLALDTAFVPETSKSLADKQKGRLSWAIYVMSRRVPPLAVMLIPVLLAVLYPMTRRWRAEVVSLSVLALGAAGAVTGLVWLTGSWWSLVHFWLAPLFVHACWLGYYALSQHTHEDIPILDADEWTASRGQLLGTVNTLVPRLVSRLHSNSEFHLVHHISPAIPSYNMRDAHEALMRSPYRSLVREVPFSLSSFLRLTRRLHVWDADARSYLTLAEWRQRRG